MKINWRTWHAWLSVILSLPLFIVGVTALFIAHGKTLGLNKMDIDALWLPGYAMAVSKQEPVVVKAAIAADGVWYVGGKTGLFILRAGRAEAVDALRGADVRSIAGATGKLVVGAKTGVWLGGGNDWRRLHDIEVFTAGTLPDGAIFAAPTTGGLVVSRDDGRTWLNDAAAIDALALLPVVREETLTMNRLIMDLHTGKAFLGKHWEWLWIDILGGIMIFLSLTGVYLWWMGQRRKALTSAGWQHL